MSTPKDFSPVASLPLDEFAALASESPVALANVPPDPNDPSWNIPAALFVLAASYLFLFVLQTAFIVPYAFHKNMLASGGAALKQFLLTDKIALLLIILSVFPAHLLTIAVAWAVVTRFGKRPFWAALGWSWSSNFGFWKSVGAALVLLALGLSIAKAIGGGETDVEKIISSSTAALYATAFLATFTAPLVEEIVYRGVLYPTLQRRIGVLWAIIGVAALFASVHILQYSNNLGVIAAVGLLSLALTVIRAFTGKLLPCFVIHMIFNGIQSAGSVLLPYLERFYSHTEIKSVVIIALARGLHLHA